MAKLTTKELKTTNMIAHDSETNTVYIPRTPDRKRRRRLKRFHPVAEEELLSLFASFEQRTGILFGLHSRTSSTTIYIREGLSEIALMESRQFADTALATIAPRKSLDDEGA